MGDEFFNKGVKWIYKVYKIRSQETKMEVEEELSDTQKHENYLQLINAIKYIEEGGRISEDWCEESKKYVRKWREWIPDFSEINEEREDNDFRKLCNETETIMKYIYGTILRTNYLDSKLYLLLLQHMKKILDMLEEDNELDNMLKMMSI